MPPPFPISSRGSAIRRFPRSWHITKFNIFLISMSVSGALGLTVLDWEIAEWPVRFHVLLG